ncbi:MAG: addiction module HigA family antidote [Psychrobacter glaciei]|jgi:addiction module HigA family antidote|uniref:HigA family addiction module antitoxin n=1 Tax=Psychrobacter TaxID=497 RepID=UPI000288539E|nr:MULTISPECIES: HigA family addiction module antitoxin [Psychrobacter]MCH1781635.1 HigA family addiction module antitoxin [Psychrobacter glaciei]|tara:strand:+ start:271 stop:570 length:300 start_codon:yes stop_codon:yes gene_type:complete
MIKNGMRPIHPGEVLQEDFLEPLGMSANALANKLGVTPARISEIVREKRGITADTALRLAKYFGGSAQFWLNLQSTYELRVVETDSLQFLDDIEPIEYA